jgi:hypothetical protein
MRAPLPTTDALFAHEVEQKMSKLLAGFGELWAKVGDGMKG